MSTSRPGDAHSPKTGDVRIREFPRTIVDDIDERLRLSASADFRDSLFVGFDVFAARNLVLLPAELRVNGLWLLGAMRSGKSACATSLGVQLLRRNRGPLVVVDMKGDDEQMHSYRIEAERLQRPFLLYSNVSYYPTRMFNPLDQKHLGGLTRAQVAELVATSMNLVHGFDYGKFHFTTQTLSAFADAIVRPAGRGWTPSTSRERVTSFVELPRRIQEAARARRELKNTEALMTVVSQLADIPALNAVKGLKWFSDEVIEGGIQISDLFLPDAAGRYPVVYLYLRAESQPIGAPMTGKLFLNLLKNGLRQFTDACKQGWVDAEPVEVDVIIDEAAYILDRSLRNLIDQGASMGLRFILANQDISQLAADDPRFAKSLFENIGNKILFTMRESSWQDEVMKLSGEKSLHHISYTISGGELAAGRVAEGAIDDLYDVRREPGPRLERNHLIEISDTPNRAVFIPAQGAGVARYGGYPLVVDIPFLHSPEMFAYLQSLPWPAQTEDMILPAEFQDEWEDHVAQQRR